MDDLEHPALPLTAEEFKIVLRLRQLSKKGARVMIDTDTWELQELNRIEPLKSKHTTATRPVASIIFDA